MSNEDIIAQYLRSLGIPATPFADIKGMTGIRRSSATHVSLNVDIQIINDAILIAQFCIGFLPKGKTVAPILRQMVSANATMIGAYYCIIGDDAIHLRAARKLDGMTMPQLKVLLDDLCSLYWSNAQNLVQTFQIPLQPEK
jgi:hypothetical protein